VSGLILGSLVWLLLFCYGLVTWSVNQRHVYPQSVPPAGQKKAHARPVTAYAPRIKTFLLFLVFPIAIATLLQPLRLRTVHWSPQSVWRFNSILYALTQALMLVTVLLALWRLSGRPAFADFLKSVGLYTRNIRTDLGVAVGLYCLALPVLTAVTVLSGWFFRGFDTPPHPTLIWIQVLDSPLDRSLTYLQAALIAPIVEEVIFRGVLYPALRERWGVLTGIALSSVLFSLMHPNLPGGFLPLAALGASFAVAFQLRGSLLPGILMHSLHNFLTLYMQFAVVSS
jgi:membrane protease YdiL (CAAX protease family)